MKKNGTKICKYCKSEIPAGAKVCPVCRKKQGVKIWQIILAVVIVFVVIGALSGGDSTPTAESTSDNQSVANDNSAGADSENKTEFAQNETVNYNDVLFTVTNVTKSAGSEFDKPRDGYEFVIVSIKIENNSSDKISYNPFDWKMENSNGQEESMTITTVDSDTSLSSGDLNPGGTVEGTVTFEQPIGDAGLKLNYYDNMLFDDDAAFKILIN